MTHPTQHPAWQQLQHHAEAHGDTSMTELFAAQPGRFDRFQLEAAGIFLDFSKNRITDETHELLVELARQSDVEGWRDAMFRGDRINTTENRAALHTALRNRSGEPLMVDGEDVMPPVREVLERMGQFSDRVRSGEWRGFTGQTITDIVNIGIGGSDLGPLMAVEALAPFRHQQLQMHFVSNVDGVHIASTLARVDPERTLFIVASKTFTTQETLTNAHTARRWFLEAGAQESDIARHFVAVSTNADEVSRFGIDTDNMFGFWDWVGGRYSLWSAIGLPLMLAIGAERFGHFLDGGYAMDQHFQAAPLAGNLPVTLALLSVWYTNFLGATSHLIAPYDQLLHRLPAYLQQLTMESNGKSVHRDGSAVTVATEPVVWGEPGTNGQHAFFQLLHQGTHLIPVDFILPLESLKPIGRHHELLIANCFAQSEALMCGKSQAAVEAELREAGRSDDEIAALAPHRVFQGNRPSNTLLVHRFDPFTLGALIALYEHKVFVEAVLWDINPFDQWGVELGKQLAKSIAGEMRSAERVSGHDSSTNGLVNRALKLRGLQA